MPLSSQDFRRAAQQRLDTAHFLLDNRKTLDAMYLAGYALECSLKALILDQTPTDDQANMLKRISQGSRMHRPEVLLEVLARKGIWLPLTLVKRLRRSTWTTDLRYQSGRLDTSEVRVFLKTVDGIHQWVGGQLS